MSTDGTVDPEVAKSVEPVPDLTDEDTLGIFASKDMILALLDCGAQGIISINVQGRIMLANRRVCEMFGYNRRELVGNRIELLLPESKRASHTRQRDQFMAHPQVRSMGIGMELVGRRKDATEFPIEVALSYIDRADGRIGIAFVADISKRKDLEDQLLHSQKMEAVGRLAGGVAHDLNNMLTVISGYHRMILDEASPLDPLRGYAEEVLNASDRAAALTNQLLSFSRRQVMQPRVVNPNTVVRQSETMLRRLIGEDVELIFKLSQDAGNIFADPAQLEQIVANLVANSRDAMPLGGTVIIETRNEILDNSYTHSHLGMIPVEFVMIAVSDNGNGMDSETKKHMFEPFFTTKAQGKRAGLGLATVYGMVKQSGGDIWVYSQPQQGTTLKLYFPKVTSDETVEATALTGLPVGGNETILLVEDEDAVRNVTVKILRKLGYTVLVAADGKQALELARENSGTIHLLLTDVVMPKMNGKQLAETLKASYPEMAILFISGYTEHTAIRHGLLEKGVAFLPKPFTKDVLAKKLRELLRIAQTLKRGLN